MEPRSVELNKVYTIDPIIEDLPLALVPNIPVIPGRLSKLTILFSP
jgi:hypothetical protein